MDKKGKLIIEMLYDGVSKFENGLALVSKDDKHWLYIDEDGNDVAKMLLKNLSGK
ncbi:WG repeat-containing protein [Halpernia sp. GG3]